MKEAQFLIYISIVFSAVKTFKTSLIKDLNLTADRFDIEPELVRELAGLNKKIHEVSINYNPRSRKDGKKIDMKYRIVK